jgi:hypothetical protein
MKEHLNFSLPTVNYNNTYYYNIIICLIIAIIVVYPILGVTSIQAILAILLLYLIIYVIVYSMTTENLSNELPSTLYPLGPHTGLDGISLSSYTAGLSTNNYN